MITCHPTVSTYNCTPLPQLLHYKGHPTCERTHAKPSSNSNSKTRKPKLKQKLIQKMKSRWFLLTLQSSQTRNATAMPKKTSKTRKTVPPNAEEGKGRSSKIKSPNRIQLK